MKVLALLFFTTSFLFASVDINNASLKELKTLKGVANVKASAIVDFRKGYCFKKVNELMLVKGIGAKTVSKNKDNLIAGPCK